LSQMKLRTKTMAKKPKMHAGDIELALAYRYKWRQNLIVPNVYYGLNFRYELDLMVVTPAGWATEIEIKVSLSDLKADKKKTHDHRSNKIKYLYFAVPENLQSPALELIPERAGLFIVRYEPAVFEYNKTEAVKSPITNNAARKITTTERIKLNELATMRIWSLKRIIYGLQRNS